MGLVAVFQGETVDHLELIKSRRSDRHFSDRPVTQAEIDALIEAFRWAPSSTNRQPWRLLFAVSAAARAVYDDALSAGNKPWAPAAPVKILVIGNPAEQPDRNGMHVWLLDCGLALENMLLQGYAMGMTIHAMAGYDEKKLLSGFQIPEPFRVAAVVAAGWRGKVESLPEEVRAKDLKPRVRKDPAEFVFSDTFGGAR
jgi:nitroreductase